jgi:tRNA nucleotidyltransferase (CCA-adding enzyme)
MHIILTHEQADFDALASLFGAHLLNESAIPVLPRRMNRNVRAFLTLYGADLPFVDPRDLDGEPIDAVTLVDTQSMVSIKGMVDDVRVRVIDHHPLKDNLPKEWVISNVEIGATTTLLIEALREHNGVLTTIQATLLLLGIYEDTGSLTYTRTTPRDVRAAAFLLEQGASLQIASDFLNHPLSQKQQELYDILRQEAEVHHVHGHTIIIAIGDAQDIEEELSSVAHKLRDLLDPDALFLFLKTGGGVQLIARSTSDNIDVSKVTANFGGGGHERAAAGLIRGRGLDELRAELVRLLPECVEPAITVAQIMSRGPQLLSPETPVEKAAERMRRYGYEGYPVVQDGKVIGLLTRRAVDRALSHQLNLTAASLMEAGEFNAHPGDSIEKLQRLMTDSGWGQIPVVNPDSGDIVGIVTRTDLLKILAPQPQLPGRQNLADRLNAALPPTLLALLKAVAQAAHEQRAALYIVGGFVRDLLLNRPSFDFDLVVEGDAITLARSLAKTYGGRVTAHTRFGTAKWHIADIRPRLVERLSTSTWPTMVTDSERRTRWPAKSSTSKQRASRTRLYSQISQGAYEDIPEFLDLVSARTEFYTYPSALPTVERGSIKLDLHRRDFTINTLALRLDGRHYGELHDYWGGLNDLRHHQVRVLHSLSFVDDPTRMLRAVRFEQRFDFQIEERTLELLHEAISLLDRVSGDRIRHEMDHILSENRMPQILARLDRLGLLTAIHPALKYDRWLSTRLEELGALEVSEDWELSAYQNGTELQKDVAYTLMAIRLSIKQAKEMSTRLKLSANLKNTILAACQLWRDLPDLATASPSQAVHRLESVPPLARYAVYVGTQEDGLRKVLESYATHWRKIDSTIDGHDLRSRGIPPGPIYRHILGTLRDAWLDGKIHTEEQEKALLEKLIEEQ